MNLLNAERLFLECPYAVRQEGNEYTFKTDNDILYGVEFKESYTFYLRIVAVSVISRRSICYHPTQYLL